MLSLLLTNFNKAEKLSRAAFDKSDQHIIFLVLQPNFVNLEHKNIIEMYSERIQKKFLVYFSSHIFDPDIEVSFILTCRRIILELLDAFLQKLLQVSLLAPLGEGLLHPHDVAVPGLERVRARIRSQRSFKFPKNDFKRLGQMLVK